MQAIARISTHCLLFTQTEIHSELNNEILCFSRPDPTDISIQFVSLAHHLYAQFQIKLNIQSERLDALLFGFQLTLT